MTKNILNKLNQLEKIAYYGNRSDFLKKISQDSYGLENQLDNPQNDTRITPNKDLSLSIKRLKNLSFEDKDIDSLISSLNDQAETKEELTSLKSQLSNVYQKAYNDPNGSKIYDALNLVDNVLKQANQFVNNNPIPDASSIKLNQDPDYSMYGPRNSLNDKTNNTSAISSNTGSSSVLTIAQQATTASKKALSIANSLSQGPERQNQLKMLNNTIQYVLTYYNKINKTKDLKEYFAKIEIVRELKEIYSKLNYDDLNIVSALQYGRAIPDSANS